MEQISRTILSNYCRQTRHSLGSLADQIISATLHAVESCSKALVEVENMPFFRFTFTEVKEIYLQMFSVSSEPMLSATRLEKVRAWLWACQEVLLRGAKNDLVQRRITEVVSSTCVKELLTNFSENADDDH